MDKLQQLLAIVREQKHEYEITEKENVGKRKWQACGAHGAYVHVEYLLEQLLEGKEIK